MYFHGARFSNYEAWLSDPIHIKPSAQVVWPLVGQEILNGDVGGGFQGIQITSGLFQLWRAGGITSELQLYTTAIGGLLMAAAMFFAGWFHYHKAAPRLEWFQNVESMLNHHLAGLLGLGSLAWAGHQIHVSLPINKLTHHPSPARPAPTPALSPTENDPEPDRNRTTHVPHTSGIPGPTVTSPGWRDRCSGVASLLDRDQKVARK